MGNIKKIMYFLDFACFLGGSNKVLLTQAYIMKQRGYQVKVIKPIQEDYAEECNEICRKYDLDILSAHYTISTCMENIDILEVLREYKDIVKLLEVNKPDFIHSAQLNISVELAARELAIPHLMNIYQVDWETFNLNWTEVYPQYHSADSLLISERWERGLKIPSKCIRVAYEEKRTKRNHIKKKEQETVTILSIGVLCERKNQLELIKFALRCRQTGQSIKVVFLGDYNNFYGKKCREFASENKLEDSVIFAGFVLNIEDYFEKGDLLIVASSVESYPGVIVESMANKVPIISTPVAGVPELLINGETGFLTEGYEENHIYEAFLRYLDSRNKNQIEEIVENAYRTYLMNHTYEVVGSQLDDYYQWIVSDYRNKHKVCLTAAKIEHIFQEICMDKQLDEIKPEMRNQIWFLYHVFSKIEQKDNKKIVVWGAGFLGGRILEWIRAWGKETEFRGFIDTYKQGVYLGYPILQQREDVIEECGTIFIAAGNQKAILEIMQYLETHGKVRNQDYFLVCNSPLIRI